MKCSKCSTRENAVAKIYLKPGIIPTYVLHCISCRHYVWFKDTHQNDYKKISELVFICWEKIHNKDDWFYVNYLPRNVSDSMNKELNSIYENVI